MVVEVVVVVIVVIMVVLEVTSKLDAVCIGDTRNTDISVNKIQQCRYL